MAQVNQLEPAKERTVGEVLGSVLGAYQTGQANMHTCLIFMRCCLMPLLETPNFSYYFPHWWHDPQPPELSVLSVFPILACSYAAVVSL